MVGKEGPPVWHRSAEVQARRFAGHLLWAAVHKQSICRIRGVFLKERVVHLVVLHAEGALPAVPVYKI